MPMHHQVHHHARGDLAVRVVLDIAAPAELARKLDNPAFTPRHLGEALGRGGGHTDAPSLANSDEASRSNGQPP